MKIKQDLDADPSILAVGINCLNESILRNHSLPGVEPALRRATHDMGLRRGYCFHAHQIAH